MTTRPLLARAETVEPGFHISSQPSADEVTQAKAAGFRTLLNNRPDFEGGQDRPTSAKLEAAGREGRRLPPAAATCRPRFPK